jgi:hypothetical protein
MENWLEGRISSIDIYENLNEITFKFINEYDDDMGFLNIRDPYTKTGDKIKELLLNSLNAKPIAYTKINKELVNGMASNTCGNCEVSVSISDKYCRNCGFCFN